MIIVEYKIIINNIKILKYPEVSWWQILSNPPLIKTLLGDSQDRLTWSLIGLSPWENFNPIGGW